MFAIGLGVVLLAAHFVFKRGPADEHAAPPIDFAAANQRRKSSQVSGPAARPTPSPSSGELNNVAAPNNRHSPTQPSPMPPGAPASTWNPAVFAEIEWRRFEAVCETLFAQAGFETKAQSHGADGGVDIWLHSKNAEGPVAVVQCKHWQGKPVGVKELREFFGVMASHGLKRGTYATTSTYTADAKAFARSNSINAMDGTDLLALIAKRTAEQQAALLAVAYEGEYWRPTCASCGIKLLERKPAKGGAPFWGCSNYPRCKTRIYMAAKA
ncbi:restriction endonuclease [Hydrogenophaga sp.]|uniref:restriction endonuclease n=1 Tax=Hydrogenophaga sp. TaxID=1904254 RepID=UPI00356516E0